MGALGGRKISIGVQILLVGALIISYMTLPYNFYLMATLYFAFQFISMCCAMCLNLYMAESFPTLIRNTGFGVINASGRCAVAAAQWLVPISMPRPARRELACSSPASALWAACDPDFRLAHRTASLEECC